MKRIVLPVAAAAVALAFFAGCSKTDTTATTNTTQAAAQSSSGDAKSSTTKGVGDVSIPGNVTMPGGGDVNKTMADAQKCLDMSTAYAGLFTPIMGGGSDSDKAAVEKKLQEMKAQVPDKIKTDLTTIEDGIKNANGLIELGNFFSSSTYTTANTNVTNYLTNECNKVGQ